MRELKPEGLCNELTRSSTPERCGAEARETGDEPTGGSHC